MRDELAKARPDYGFLGEEGGARAGSDKSHRWIVDPLDGTTNFLHGIPHFAVSIGLERDGAIVAGVVYNPANDEVFVAERGKGAYLNDKRIRVAARQKLADAVVACGLPHYGRGDLALARHEIAAAQQNFAGLRRYGAATLDLAWIACGRLDAYWERNLSPWDLAAGSLSGARSRRLRQRLRRQGRHSQVRRRRRRQRFHASRIAAASQGSRGERKAGKRQRREFSRHARADPRIHEVRRQRIDAEPKRAYCRVKPGNAKGFRYVPTSRATRTPRSRCGCKTWQAAYPQFDFAARLSWWRARWASEIMAAAKIVIAQTPR